jgi:uncharacterized protein YndB with AHSA1/START domain
VTTPTIPTVRIRRTIAAPPHQVYRAWLDPDLLTRWMAPGPFEATRIEVDERVGGHFRVWHGTSEGDAGGFEAEIVELVPDRRIAFRWGFVGPERMAGPCFDSQLVVELAEGPGHTTELTLVHDRLDDLAAARPEAAGQVGVGWGMVLDKLASLVA